jgi:hypothetical protein
MLTGARLQLVDASAFKMAAGCSSQEYIVRKNETKNVTVKM